jgi:hypothetical protein
MQTSRQLSIYCLESLCASKLRGLGSARIWTAWRARPAIANFYLAFNWPDDPQSKKRLFRRRNQVPAATAAQARDVACLTRDGPQLFRNRFAFFSIVNYESVIIAMSGPRTARHFAEIYELPLGYVCFF